MQIGNAWSFCILQKVSYARTCPSASGGVPTATGRTPTAATPAAASSASPCTPAPSPVSTATRSAATGASSASAASARRWRTARSRARTASRSTTGAVRSASAKVRPRGRKPCHLVHFQLTGSLYFMHTILTARLFLPLTGLQPESLSEVCPTYQQLRGYAKWIPSIEIPLLSTDLIKLLVTRSWGKNARPYPISELGLLNVNAVRVTWIF